LETDEDLNYLAKFVEQFFTKTHLDASESAKNTFFHDVTKVESLDNFFYFIEKEPKSSFKHFASVDQKPR
jgi:hypothetical protein